MLEFLHLFIYPCSVGVLATILVITRSNHVRLVCSVFFIFITVLTIVTLNNYLGYLE